MAFRGTASWKNVLTDINIFRHQVPGALLHGQPANQAHWRLLGHWVVHARTSKGSMRSL